MDIQKNQIVIYKDEFYIVKSKPFKILHSDMVVLTNKVREITVNVKYVTTTNLYEVWDVKFYFDTQV